MKNGLLRDYASHLPQKDRVSLVRHGLFLLQVSEIMSHFQISDVIDSLVYLNKLNFNPESVRGVCLVRLSFL
jgi:hypothetical protein